MAGIFDGIFGGGDQSQALSPAAGILSGTSGYSQQSGGSNGLGLFGATLSDIGAHLSGRPQDATNIASFRQMNQSRQILSALTSPDPAIRQQAYAIAPAFGIDPSQFQKSQANAATPSLLNNLQPQFNPVQVTPQVGNGPGATPLSDPARAAAANTPLTYNPTLSQALTDTGSPELSAQFAPEIIKQQLERQDKAATTLTPDEVRLAGFKPGTVVQKDTYGNLKVAQPSDVKSQGAIAQDLYLKSHDPHLPIDRANLAVSQGRLQMEKDKIAAGIPDELTLHDMATRYVSGDKSVATGMSRNPQTQTAFQNMISQVGREQGLTPAQVSKNQQTFQAGAKAVQAFDTGKQGDTVRSLNVSVSHLETLRNLGEALNNGDVRIINAAKQKFAEEFGVPAPTNFDAAKSIVADEVAKGVIGGQSAQSDRETLAASLRRSGGPAAINGAISTFQDLLGGQLKGLRQQYKSSTGREDFNDKLFPDTLARLDPAKTPAKAAPINPASLPRVGALSKTIGGVTYTSPDGGKSWFH